MCSGNPSFLYTRTIKCKTARHRIVFPSRAIIIHVAAMLLHGNDSIKLCLPNVGRTVLGRTHSTEIKRGNESPPLIYACYLVNAITNLKQVFCTQKLKYHNYHCEYAFGWSLPLGSSGEFFALAAANRIRKPDAAQIHINITRLINVCFIDKPYVYGSEFCSIISRVNGQANWQK